MTWTHSEDIAEARASGFLDDYCALGRAVYADDTVWVPEDPRMVLGAWEAAVPASHEQAEAGFRAILAMEDGKPVARVCAFYRREGSGASADAVETKAWLGQFECLPGREAAGLEALACGEAFLRGLGARSVCAPKNDNQYVGLQTDGFELPQTVLTPHHPPYYRAIFEAAGYAVHRRLYCYLVSKGDFPPLTFLPPGFRLRSFDRGRLDEEIVNFHELQNGIFSDDSTWIPRSLSEDERLIRSMLPLLDDDFVLIAADPLGRPAGLVVALPDAYQRAKEGRVTRLRIMSIGTLRAYRRYGLGAAMLGELARRAWDKGYEEAEASWILESNLAPQNLARRFHARPGRQFALFGKQFIEVEKPQSYYVKRASGSFRSDRIRFAEPKRR